MPADDDLLRRAAEANAASFAAIAAASAGGRSLAQPGVRAIATPAAPERPLFNVAFALEPGALAGAFDRLAAFYAEAGIPRWIAFVDPQDAESVAALAANGHVLDGEPRMMIAPADDVAGADPAVELDPAPRPETIVALNDRSYGYPGRFGRTLRSLDGLDACVAVVDAEPVACALAHHAGGDCHITTPSRTATSNPTGRASQLSDRPWPQHVPPLIDRDDYSKLLSDVLLGVNETDARAFCAVCLVKLLDQCTWQYATNYFSRAHHAFVYRT